MKRFGLLESVLARLSELLLGRRKSTRLTVTARKDSKQWSIRVRFESENAASHSHPAITRGGPDNLLRPSDNSRKPIC